MASHSGFRRYKFGAFELQPDERRLLAAGALVALGPRALDVLLALVENSGRLVTKEELLDRVWPSAIVVENALQVHISALRKSLGAGAITTVSGRGYRFALDVEEVRPESSPSSATKHNLPQPSTSFIGRTKEVADVKLSLDRTRLLTLTGSGGCGKTRLATEVAQQLASKYPDGVWFVELASINDPELVPQTVAGILSCKEQRGKTLTQLIAEAIGAKRGLLLLDNAEHVGTSVAEMVDALLRECAHVVIFVTSRQQLGLAGELTYRVPSLAVPDPKREVSPEKLASNDSVRLFVERARLQRAHFVLGPDNADLLTSICHRLDGIPLAIELAAPRVRTMSLEEIDRRLDQRLVLLTGGSKQGPHRQRTLRAMLDWSYDLLRVAEQELFRRCSVFTGGWTLKAAEQVCVADGCDATLILGLLNSLGDKNLMLEEDQEGGTRYRMLETVRQYARERLVEDDDVALWQTRHQAHFLALAEVAAPDLSTANPWPVIHQLEQDHDNFRAALAWSARLNPSAGIRLAAALWYFWFFRGYYVEGLSTLTSMLAAATANEAAARGRALNGAGALASILGKYQIARSFQEEGLRIRREIGEQRDIATSLSGLASALIDQGKYAEARTCYEECLAILRDLGDPVTTCAVLGNMSNLALFEGDLVRARLFSEESLAIRRDLGFQWGIAISLLNLTTVLREQGDLMSARARSDEAVASLREVEESRFLAIGLMQNADIVHDSGEPEAAKAAASEALSLMLEIGDQRYATELLSVCAAISTSDSVLKAARLWGAAERLRELIQPPRYPTDLARDALRIDAARVSFDNDAAFEAAWNEGRNMDMERALAYALEATTGGPSR